MALTPNANDPNRQKILGEMKKMHDGGDVGKGTLKQSWNADKPPSNPTAKPIESKVEKEPEPVAGKK